MLPPLLLLPLTLVTGSSCASPNRRHYDPPPRTPYTAPAIVPYNPPTFAREPRVGEVLITGRVTTEVGQVLFGANVTIEVLHISVGTGENGYYRLLTPPEARGRTVVLRARLFGFAPQVKSVTLDKDTLTFDFSLSTDVNRLSQVVVTGDAERTEKVKAPFSIAQVPAPAAGAATAPPTPAAPPLPPATPPSVDLAPSRWGRTSLAGESYARIHDNPFYSPRSDPLSTFGIDVDRASYTNVRRIITRSGQRPPPDAVRIEEMLNYFTYDYEAPTDDHPFAVHADVSRAPWAAEHLLVRIGLQARTIDLEDAPANNLVFLIDVSGSMQSHDKLPLLQEAFCLLVEQLRPQDRVAIVTYAGREGLLLNSTSGDRKERIQEAIRNLRAGGSTAGAAGITLAYKIAKDNFIVDGNNRVILATDGDFNVGVTSNAELERMVEEKRRDGTFLTVLGFGTGNIHDDRMEMLADRGNGNYSYIDTRDEARKVLVNEAGGTLVAIAKDVKLQIEFNPLVVAGYRLIGYENRVLEAADFRDDRKDAGDMGSGHSVTALYEIIPVSAEDARDVRRVDTSRYLRPTATRRGSTDELLFVRLRYKQPTDSVSVPFEVAVPNRVAEASADFRFAQAVAAFGMLLRESDHRGSATPEMVLGLARGALGRDEDGLRAQFVSIVQRWATLPGVVAKLPDR